MTKFTGVRKVPAKMTSTSSDITRHGGEHGKASRSDRGAWVRFASALARTMATWTAAARATVFTAALAACLAAMPLAFGPAPARAEADDSLTVQADGDLEWDRERGVYTATGNVIATRGDAELRGDAVVASYDPRDSERAIQRVILTGNASFRSLHSRAVATKLTYDVATGRYHLNGPAARIEGRHGALQATDSILVTTQSDDSLHMKAQGNSIFVDASGRRFAGEVISARFDARGNLQHVKAEGGVLLETQAGRQARGDEAEFEAQSERATLTGNVEVTVGQDTLFGTRAEVDFKSGNSRIISTNPDDRVSGVFDLN